MKAEEFFKDPANKSGLCYETPVVEARKVKAGEPAIVNVGFNIAARAEEDGWQIVHGGKFLFVNDAELAKEFKAIKITGTKELPEGATVKRVRKGEEILTQPFSDSDLGIISHAATDGWIVKLPENGNKAVFLSDCGFRAEFKTKAAKPKGAAEQGFFQYQVQADDKPVRYVVLAQAGVIDFKAGPYEAPAGTAIYENAKDEDGFTAVPAEYFAQNFTVTTPKAATPLAKPARR